VNSIKILICGDRNWDNIAKIREILTKINLKIKIAQIIEGECRGADTFGKIIAEELHIPIKKFPAQWAIHKRKAGIIRNYLMLKENPDLVLAFHNNIKKSSGTRHMVGIAKSKGIKTKIITENDRINNEN